MADPLSFGSELNQAQRDAARKIIERAIEMGVDPRLAVSLAFAESSLRLDTDDSNKGAIGIMQVTPDTGQTYGFSKKDLRDPDRNIEAGLTVLKSLLNKFPNDPRLAIVAYNGGPGTGFFQNKELLPETAELLKRMKGFGAFAATGSETSAEPTDTGVEEGVPAESEMDVELPESPRIVEQQPLPSSSNPPSNSDFQKFVNLLQGMDEGDLATGAGAIAGYKIGQNTSQMPMPSAGVAGQPAPGGAAQPSGLPAEPAAPRAGVLPTGGMTPGRPAGGPGGFNYGKAFGLTDIEAGQAKSMAEAAELVKNRAGVLSQIEGMEPSLGRYVEDPQRGLMLPSNPTVGRGPKQSFVQTPKGLQELPPRQSIAPIGSKPIGALENVMSVFRNMMSNPLMRRAIPIAGGALAGGELDRAAQELRKENPDYVTAALKGLSGVGGVMSLFPPTTSIGVPLSMGAEALQFGHERVQENARQNKNRRWSPVSLRTELNNDTTSFSEPSGYEQKVIPSNPMGDFGF
jgi:hypothetical protein